MFLTENLRRRCWRGKHARAASNPTPMRQKITTRQTQHKGKNRTNTPEQNHDVKLQKKGVKSTPCKRTAFDAVRATTASNTPISPVRERRARGIQERCCSTRAQLMSPWWSIATSASRPTTNRFTTRQRSPLPCSNPTVCLVELHSTTHHGKHTHKTTNP